MNSALWGALSSASLGAADFMGRFSGRAVGATLTYGLVLLVGTILATLAVIFSGMEIVWSAYGWTMAIIQGISVSVMCVLLYAGLARGPVAIVAPIVAAHPIFVLAINVAMGLRPGPMEWLAMSAILAGGILIARSAGSHPQFAGPGGSSEMRKTILIAFGSCLAYVAIVLSSQAAAPVVGELQTLWISRWAGLIFVAIVLAVQGTRPVVSASWLPFITLQGVLDGLGYLTFLAGATSTEPHIAMVIASTFSVFTVLLAKIFLKEPISAQQWAAIASISIGTAALAGHG
ncbi:MAG: DMT family transporter [Rhizobiales bacterium]|nr:DMT family transporter [Hyphomicrobiales bacterium]